VALVTGHPGQTIRDGGEAAVVGVHLTNKGVAGPAVAGLGVAVGGAAVGLLVGPLDAPEDQQAPAVPVGALAVEAFGMPNRPADQDLQRPGTGDPDLAELAAGQPEQVVGVVGGASGGGDEPLVAAVAVGVDRPPGDQPVGADPVRAVGQRQVGNAAAGQQDADVPPAGLPGRIQLGVGQQLVAGLVAVEVAGDARDPGGSARQEGRVVGTGPGLGVAGLVGRGAVRRARFAGDRSGWLPLPVRGVVAGPSLPFLVC
jgi:hypothetical protein